MQKYLAQAAIVGTSLLIAAVLLVVGVGFFGAAIYLALRDDFTPPMAALLTGICGVALAAIIALAGHVVGRLTRSSMRRERAPGKDAPAAAGVRGVASEFGVLAGEQIAALARSHVHGTLAASLLAGFAVGISPGLRKLLLDLLKI